MLQLRSPKFLHREKVQSREKESSALQGSQRPWMAQPKACQDWNPSSYPAVQCWASLSIILGFLVCGAGTDPMSTWVEGTQSGSRPVAAHLYYGGCYFLILGFPVWSSLFRAAQHSAVDPWGRSRPFVFAGCLSAFLAPISLTCMFLVKLQSL